MTPIPVDKEWVVHTVSKHSIFYRFNLEWKTRTLEVLHKQLDVTFVPTTIDPLTWFGIGFGLTPYTSSLR